MLLYFDKNLIKASLVAFAMWLFLFANYFGGNDVQNFYKVSSITSPVGIWDVNNWNPYELSYDITRELRMSINIASSIISDSCSDDIRESELKEQIAEEERLGEIELLAQLIEAEAGNQDIDGKKLVADVVLNRVASDRFPNTIEEVIFEDSQFSCVGDGGFEKAGWNISEESYEAALSEYYGVSDSSILFFTCGYYNPYCIPMYKYGAHYFGR